MGAVPNDTARPTIRTMAERFRCRVRQVRAAGYATGALLQVLCSFYRYRFFRPVPDIPTLLLVGGLVEYSDIPMFRPMRYRVGCVH